MNQTNNDRQVREVKTRHWAVTDPVKGTQKVLIAHRPFDSEGKRSKWPFSLPETLFTLRDLIAVRDAANQAIEWAESNEALAIATFESIDPSELQG